MRMRKLTHNEKLTCEPMLMGEHMTGKDVAVMTLVKPITLNFLEPMVLLLNLYIALVSIHKSSAMCSEKHFVLTDIIRSTACCIFG